VALESSGAMSLGGATATRSVNCELGKSGTAQIGMNDADARTLAGKASGAIAMSDFYGKSSGPPPPTTIGTYYADHGGYYTGTQSGYYLFASTVNANGYQWKTTVTASSGTTSTTDGYSNTYAQKNATHPLFNYVGSLTTAGFSDWYVGARCELQQQYNNRTAGSLNGTYTTCTYWSSTEGAATDAWKLWFNNGVWYGNDILGKCVTNYCGRPIRRSS